MVYESLIAIAESHLSDPTQTWLEEVKKPTHLNTYQKLSNKELFYCDNILFVKIQNWLTETYHALHIGEKVLWSFIAWENNTNVILEANYTIEFMTLINNYFNLGGFNLMHSNIDKLHTQLNNSKKNSATELENLIPSETKHQISISKYLFNKSLKIDSI